MTQLRKIIFLFVLFCAQNVFCETADLSAAKTAQKIIPADETVSYTEAFALGLIEGITEFLPISSTGHLILANTFMSLSSDDLVSNAEGEVIISRKPDENGNPKGYTMKEAVDAYAIVIQFAAIMAVALIYWSDIFSMLKGLLGKDKNGLLLARNLLVAFLPAAFIGFFIHDYIEELFSTLPVVIAIFCGAIAMIYFQKKYQKKFAEATDAPVELHSLTIKQSLTVGLLQCVALWPGTSRSMMTILGSYIVGLRPVQAAKFSFLLGLITLSAACFYKFLEDGKQMVEALSFGPMIFGFVVAFISSALAAKWLVGFLNRKGLMPFAIYRIILAAILVFILCSS